MGIGRMALRNIWVGTCGYKSITIRSGCIIQCPLLHKCDESGTQSEQPSYSEWAADVTRDRISFIVLLRTTEKENCCKNSA